MKLTEYNAETPAGAAYNDELSDAFIDLPVMRAFARMGDSIARHDRDVRRMAYTDVLTGLSNRLAFRRAVTRQMYGTLAVLALAWVGTAVAAAGLVVGAAEWRELPAFVAAAVLFGLASLWRRYVERRARKMPVVDEEIGRQRDAVVRVWATRQLPTWRERVPA